MKLNKIMMGFTLAMGMAAAMNSAVAADAGHGKVTFKGSIIDAPCSIAPESLDQTVQLGAISNAALNDGGTSTPKTFEIKLEGCTGATAKKVTTTFSGLAGANNGLGITGTAKGASIVIQDAAGAQIELGKATAGRTLVDGTNTMNFSTFLKGDGVKDSIIPGEFTGVADFTLAYL
jgi:type 1 fimbria pilin